MRATCLTCSFFEPSVAGQGRCKRHAPNRDPWDDNGRWPVVEVTAWCGEHKEKPRKVEKLSEEERGSLDLLLLDDDDDDDDDWKQPG